MKKLSPAEIRLARRSTPEWSRGRTAIQREFIFPDFVAALKFVQQVGRAAEKAQHHPDIDIRWNRVRLRLITHDAGGLTMRDFSLAARCDALFAFAIKPRTPG